MASQITSSGYVLHGSTQLFYETEGNKKGARSILFVHGLGGTTNAYQPLVGELGDFNIVRFDWSGHGRSSVPSETSIELYVADCEDITVVGHSLGALISLSLAAKRPDLVSGVVAFGPVKPPPEAGRVALGTRAATVRQGGMVAITDTVLSNAFAARSLVSKRAEVALAREMLTRQVPEGYALAVDALARSTAPAWGEIRAKVLIVSGGEDKVSTVAAGLEIVGEIGSNAQQLVWKDVGHWHMLENPDASVEVIKLVAGVKS
ncbi:hypothetical protein SLS62_002868 [Diatrype stigma]|uniref:AB hydrolase-1 domain-containing protein n=1 Tax=Diatrype stigma TaxID=117547 RepID=A0AAN9UVL8_9PEZI